MLNNQIQQTNNIKKNQDKKFSLLLLLRNNKLESNIFLILISVRFLSVYFNLIWDCDETYNYWEPAHFLLYGNGLQTWEYSPVYSLRSYLYLYLNILPVIPFVQVIKSKIVIFYLIRVLFALAITYCECLLYKSLKKLSKIEYMFRNVHYLYLCLSCTNVGMFLSCTSFLPSTFCMFLVIYAYAQMYANNLNKSVFAIGLAILLAWPFVLILGIPVFINFLLLNNSNISKNFILFIKTTFKYAIVICAPIIIVDSFLFGKFVFAPLNIFVYNVFDSTKGPDLYGREPFSYYLKNLFLNFNLLFPLSICFVILLLLNWRKASKHACLTCLGMILWMVVFMTRPHKEERFMYPIYPLILLNSALFISTLYQQLNKYFSFLLKYFAAFVVLVHFALSMARLFALLFNYSASMQIYFKLNEPSNKFSAPHLELKQEINVCVSKEWYRFPSSFFLPEKTEIHNWNLRFLESDFKGQLPGYFNPNANFSLIQSTRFVDELFNDLNKEVKQRYFEINKCDFLIDTNTKSDDDFNKETKLNWRTLAQVPFIDQSANNNNLYKTFYIPYLYEKNSKFTFFKLKVRVP